LDCVEILITCCSLCKEINIYIFMCIGKKKQG
jgi:hypothetical protein